MHIYILDNQEQKGPFTIEELKAMIAAGECSLETPGCREGDAEWKPLKFLLPKPVVSAPPHSITNYFFMRSVLKYIDEGTLFSRVTAVALRIFSIFFSLGAFLYWIQSWEFVFRMSIVGGILAQIIFAVGVYMVVHTLWIRAAAIEAIGKTEFIIIPIASLSLRTIGEINACLSLSFGLGLGVLQLFSANSIVGSSSFFSALLLIVGSAISALLWLVLFYLASEFVGVVVDIARNTRALRDILEHNKK